MPFWNMYEKIIFSFFVNKNEQHKQIKSCSNFITNNYIFSQFSEHKLLNNDNKFNSINSLMNHIQGKREKKFGHVRLCIAIIFEYHFSVVHINEADR